MPRLDKNAAQLSRRRLSLEKRNRRSLHCAPPNFLLKLVGSASFMRLCEKKQVLD
jgi:hypothetical protein